MNIKKLTPTLLFIVCVLAAVLGFTACKEEEHVHTFSEWETMAEATCFSHGMQKRSCECGHVEYGTTQTLEHTPVVDAAIDATCTSHGMTEGSHCSVCNAIIVPQTQTEKLEHTYSEWKTYILSFLLECTNSIMGSVSPELSIRDLGFLFFNI